MPVPSQGKAKKFERVYVFTEDGDFVPAVQEVQRLGKRVENAHFNVSYLSKNCDAYVRLTPELIEANKIMLLEGNLCLQDSTEKS